MNRLAPVSEEPVTSEEDDTNSSRQSLKYWLKSLPLLFQKKSSSLSDLRTLLSVIGCPLFPASIHPKLSSFNQVSSSAQYIIQHFTAATGCRKLEGRVKNIFATGKVTMRMTDHDHLAGLGGGGGGSIGTIAEKGCFVMWQMVPNKWLIELVLGGHKVVAGSDGNVAWRHTPWLGAHTAKGGLRPLRRAIQGLDPVAIAAVFSPAQYMGEKCINGEDCFVLKLAADQGELSDRSDSTAEMIKHVTFGYFSQRSGFLVYLEDSYLTRIQSPGTYPTYWETTMATQIEDYRPVEDGPVIAHGGRSSAVITRFGDNLKAGLSSTMTRMEEEWSIDDVAFDVAGLSCECFIAPTDVQRRDDEVQLDLRPSQPLESTSSVDDGESAARRPDPPPIRVSLTESAGRGVFATRRIGAGELIHTAKPALCHPTLSSVNAVCYFCLRKLGSEGQGPGFCSRECEDEAKAFYDVEKKADWSDFDAYCRSQGLKYPQMVKRLACKVISGAASAESLDILQPASISAEMALMVSETQNIPDRMILKFKPSYTIILVLSREWYNSVLARIRINAFRIELALGSYEDLLASASACVDAEAAVGNAVYLLPSFYNHDCDPNAHIIWIDNADAKLKALRDVEADEELRICYIDASLDHGARQSVLLQGFGFECNCLRCLSRD
ncbi:Histone-lysine N-methyltransferase ATXR4 [Linum perenne]